jgi:hypothetical protein
MAEGRAKIIKNVPVFCPDHLLLESRNLEALEIFISSINHHDIENIKILSLSEFSDEIHLEIKMIKYNILVYFITTYKVVPLLEKKIDLFNSWYERKDLKELFEKTEEYIKQEPKSDIFTAIIASDLMDSTTFRNLYKEANSYAATRPVEEVKLNLTLRKSMISIDLKTKLILNNVNKTYKFELINDRYRVKNMTFTPKLELEWPETVVDACLGKNLGEIIGLPFLQDQKLIIENIQQNGKGKDNKIVRRLSFRIAEEIIGLEKACDIIDNIRSKLGKTQ